jgi:hypothetical protein
MLLSNIIIVSNIRRTNKQPKPKPQKQQTRLELLSVKELQLICSKSVTEQGTNIISNYTRLQKDDLIKKMNEVYDKLTLDFY